MNIKNVYILEDRGILFVNGPDVKEFLQNIEAKENDSGFTGDMEALLRPEIEYDQKAAFRWLKNEILKTEE